MGGRIGGASVGDASFADHKSCRRAGLHFAGWRSRSVALAERSQPSLSANPAVATGDLIKSSSQLRCNCTAWVLAGADRQDRRRRSRDLHASVAVIRRARPCRCPAVALLCHASPGELLRQLLESNAPATFEASTLGRCRDFKR